MPSRPLSRYRKKRDFRKTKEPRGKSGVLPSDRLRFVVQKHDATRLHYDLRLELGGVFRSWAVTRGPSLDPKVKRLAVEVEDHPLEYGDFEDTIPKGQYGAGTVQIWDRGYWQPETRQSAARALQAGNLKFTLDGEKMRGGWALVRLRGDRNESKRNNWLLIKHRDHAAHEVGGDDLLSNDRSIASGRSMDEIAVGKGRRPTLFLRKGLHDAQKPPQADADGSDDRQRSAARRASAHTKTKGESRDQTYKTRRVNVMPDFIPPQLCKLVERPPSDGEWGHEIKFDGYRLQLRINNGRVTVLTRNGLD